MEPGKIRLAVPNGQSNVGVTQTIAYAITNRLYRITNDGPGLMRITATRSVLWWSVVSILELEGGRSVDVVGSTITVLALDSLVLTGSYDTL